MFLHRYMYMERYRIGSKQSELKKKKTLKLQPQDDVCRTEFNKYVAVRAIVPRFNIGINTTRLQKTFLEYSLHSDRCVQCPIQKYTPTNHSDAFRVILSTTKCAESQACQMHFHSTALYPSLISAWM